MFLKQNNCILSDFHFFQTIFQCYLILTISSLFFIILIIFLIAVIIFLACSIIFYWNDMSHISFSDSGLAAYGSWILFINISVLFLSIFFNPLYVWGIYSISFCAALIHVTNDRFLYWHFSFLTNKDLILYISFFMSLSWHSLPTWLGSPPIAHSDFIM